MAARGTSALTRREPFGNVEGATEDLQRLVSPGKASLALPDGGLSMRVFAGWKGAGKTVYLKKHREEAARRSARDGFYVSDLLADLPPTTTTVMTLAQSRKRPDLPGLWTRLWRHAIVLSAATHLLFDPKLSSYLAHAPDQFASSSYVRRLSEPIDVYDTFRVLTSSAERRLSLDSTEWDRFESLTARALEHAPPVSLYVDSIDKEFEAAPSYWMRTQEGLLTALVDLINSHKFGGRLHTTITVRDMVISSIMRSTHASKMLDTGYIRTLNWDPASLRNLVLKKIRELPRTLLVEPEVVKQDSVRAWLGFSKIHNLERGVDEDALDYLIRHSRFIPRDIVDVGNTISREIESYPSSFNPERFRQIVSRMALKHGREQLFICAQEIAADLLPAGLDDLSYFGGMEHLKSMAATLEHVLRSQRTDIITSDDFALLSREIEVEFEQYTINPKLDRSTLVPIVVDALWHNRVIGYRLSSSRAAAGAYHFYGVNSDSRFDLPSEGVELALHPCMLDAVPGLTPSGGTPVIADEHEGRR
ncbi:MAG: hypothetical protein V9E89_08865 [Ilumatobacteraceae bacterium]